MKKVYQVTIVKQSTGNKTSKKDDPAGKSSDKKDLNEDPVKPYKKAKRSSKKKDFPFQIFSN